MTLQKQSQGSNYRINLRLDPEEDADIIAWLESLPDGQRSTEIRAALRQSLMQEQSYSASNANAADLEAIRYVVAEEIHKALKDKQVTSGANRASGEEDLEAKYGNKLDRMLGGFSSKQ